MKERRRHFLINKPLQFRYMAYITGTLIVISVVILISLYVSIWGSILTSFSNASVRHDLLTAARLAQYEQARYPSPDDPLTALSFFKESERLSKRQREIFLQILKDSNQQLAVKLVLLFFFIGWGSIFLSHKVAGPLYRFRIALLEIQKGNFKTRIALRKSDEAKPLAQDLNETLAYLDAHTQRLKAIVRENQNHPQRLTSQLEEELSKIKTSGD